MQCYGAVRPRRVRVLVALDLNVESRYIRAPLAQDLDDIPGRARPGAGEQQLSRGKPGWGAVLLGWRGRSVDHDLLAAVAAERGESAGFLIPGDFDGSHARGRAAPPGVRRLLADDRPDEAHEDEDAGEQADERG
jgi:hypothetical protein